MEEEKQQGRYYVFEGMDGSGKSILSKAVAQALDVAQMHGAGGGSHHMAFPSYEGEVGKLIRRVFAGEIQLAANVMGYLMVADAIDHEPSIEAVRSRGVTVICDRHASVSGWVYQTEVYPIDAVLAIQQRAQLAQPDIVFLIDVPEKVAEERMLARGGKRNPLYERDETAYVTRLRQRYLAYAFMHDNTILLNGTLPTDALVAKVFEIIKSSGGAL